MARLVLREERRERRHRRIRKKVVGITERPRLAVFKSGRHVHAQIIDDAQGHTLVHVTTMQKDVAASGCNVEAAKAVGKLIAEKAKESGVEQVVFDRGGYPYHGIVKALAESAREGGLKF